MSAQWVCESASQACVDMVIDPMPLWPAAWGLLFKLSKNFWKKLRALVFTMMEGAGAKHLQTTAETLVLFPAVLTLR